MYTHEFTSERVLVLSLCAEVAARMFHSVLCVCLVMLGHMHVT